MTKKSKESKVVNTSKIVVGDIIKNYKEFCLRVGEPEKRGNPREAQIKNWGYYIKFHKDGHKFIIDEIYKTPLPEEDRRSQGNHSIYSEYIKNLIMDLLVHNSFHNNERTLSFSTNALLKALDMINSNYMKGKNNIPRASEIMNVDEKFLYEFFTTTHSNLQGVLETALNQLKSEVYFTWYKKKVVCIQDIILDFDAFGNVKIITPVEGRPEPSYTITRKHRDATEAEEEVIMQCKDEILAELHCKNEGHVIANRQWNYYISQVNKLLKKRTNIVYFYDAYKLIINREKVKNFAELQKQWGLSNEDRTMQKGELNSLVVYNCEKNAEKRYNKTKNKVADKKNKDLSPVEEIRSDENYLAIQRFFIESFIESNTKIITPFKNYTTQNPVRKEGIYCDLMGEIFPDHEAM